MIAGPKSNVVLYLIGEVYVSSRASAQKLAAESVARGRPLDWFETLYRKAGGDAGTIPWADLTVNPNLDEWFEQARIDGTAQRALVVGCGLGDDAEALAARGFQVTAFDISPSCIDWCRRRFPDSHVDYHVADLFAPPAAWRAAFDFVLEIYTLQVLPDTLHRDAMRQIAEYVAPGGTLLVIARGRQEDDDPGKMPWPLLQQELSEFLNAGLTPAAFEDYVDDEDPPVRRFRVVYRRER